MQVSCLMTSLLQHTLCAHIEGDLFISGPLIIFGFWGWKASCWVSVRLLNRKGLFEDVFQHPAANMVLLLSGDPLKALLVSDPVCTQT